MWISLDAPLLTFFFFFLLYFVSLTHIVEIASLAIHGSQVVQSFLVMLYNIDR